MKSMTNLEFFIGDIMISYRYGTSGLVIVIYLITVFDRVCFAKVVIIIIHHFTCKTAVFVVHNYETWHTFSAFSIDIALQTIM